MAIVVKEAKTFQVDYTCDTCGEGTMKPTGAVKTSMPPWYVHCCTHCKAVQDFNRTYPYIDFSLVETPYVEAT